MSHSLFLIVYLFSFFLFFEKQQGFSVTSSNMTYPKIDQGKQF